MKTRFYFMAAIAAATLVLTGCGSSVKKLPENDILGNLPSLVYQKAQQDSIIQVKSKGSVKKLMEQMEKAEEQYLADVKAEWQNVRSRPIPFSVDEGLGYEVMEVKLVDFEDDGEVGIQFVVKIVDVSRLNLEFPLHNYQKGQFRVPLKFLNSAGEVLDTKNYQYVYLDTKRRDDVKNGNEYTQITGFYLNAGNAKDYVDFAKIDFVAL